MSSRPVVIGGGLKNVVGRRVTTNLHIDNIWNVHMDVGWFNNKYFSGIIIKIVRLVKYESEEFSIRKLKSHLGFTEKVRRTQEVVVQD